MTLNNLESDSNLLVVHSVYAFVVVIILLVIMDRFEKKYVHRDPSLQTTVMIKNFPVHRVLAEHSIRGRPHLVLARLETYFTRVLKILPSNFQIYLTFDVSDLEKLGKRYNKYSECVDYVVRKNSRHSKSSSVSQEALDDLVELSNVASRNSAAELPMGNANELNLDEIKITVEEPFHSEELHDGQMSRVEQAASNNGSVTNKSSPSPSEVVEKSYVMDSKEIEARQNGSKRKSLSPSLGYLFFQRTINCFLLASSSLHDLTAAVVISCAPVLPGFSFNVTNTACSVTLHCLHVVCSPKLQFQVSNGAPKTNT